MEYDNLKIALIHDWLNGMRGGEKVLEYFCSIFKNIKIFTLHSELRNISPVIKKHQIEHSFIQKIPFKEKYYRYLLPLYPLAVKQFRITDFDLIISTSHCAAKNISNPGNIPHLCYCFSPMRYIWSLQKDYFGSGRIKNMLINPLFRYLKKWDYEGAQKVTQFVAISETIQERIKTFYNRESLIIYPPTDLKFSPSLKKDNYFLVLSALTPYKRIDLALEACKTMNVPLKIAGTGPLYNKLKKSKGPKTEFLGWVSDDEKAELLKNAKALIFPGLEDFGIVPLEAMSFATPVIGFGEGGLTETVKQEKTGLFFKKQTVQSLTDSLKQFENRTFEAADFQTALKEFSPEIFIKKIKTVTEDILKK